MNRQFFLYLILLFPLYATATIYHWVDSKGVTHFSDRSHSDATIIHISAVSSLQQTISSPTQKNQLVIYQSLQITQPQNEATIRDNQGIVPIEITLTPTLHEGDVLQVLLDNKIVAQSSKQLAFQLDNIDRGAHEIQAQVVDATGKILITGNKNIFYLHRAN